MPIVDPSALFCDVDLRRSPNAVSTLTDSPSLVEDPVMYVGVGSRMYSQNWSKTGWYKPTGGPALVHGRPDVCCASIDLPSLETSDEFVPKRYRLNLINRGLIIQRDVTYLLRGQTHPIPVRLSSSRRSISFRLPTVELGTERPRFHARRVRQEEAFQDFQECNPDESKSHVTIRTSDILISYQL